MTRPRKPFGSNHPGRLQATMMKVLAAEMTDPARLRRGKQYAKDGSVIDIVVDPGTVTCEVQGSRSLPYIVVLAVRPGDGMPLSRDLRSTCTCPDDDNWDGYVCKHVVASMFAFSDELLLEPALLDRWRGRDVEPSDDSAEHAVVDDEPGRPPRGRRRGHLRLVTDADRLADDPLADDRGPDPLATLLDRPPGAELPPVPRLARLDTPAPPDPDLARVLDDALGHLRLDWD